MKSRYGVCWRGVNERKHREPLEHILTRASRPLFLRTLWSEMANEAAKKRVIKNKEVISKYRLILIGTNVRYSPEAAAAERN